jgi:uncharacterized protein YhhL (DUF1145 family)
MSLAKIGVGVLWLACIASFLAEPGSTAGRIGRILFWVLAATHAIECAAFYRLLKRAPGSLSHHLLSTFVFGMFHVKDVQLELQGDASAPK